VAVTFRDQPQMKADYSRFSGDYYSHLEGSEPSRKEPLGCYSSWGNSGAPVVTTDHLYISFHSLLMAVRLFYTYSSALMNSQPDLSFPQTSLRSRSLPALPPPSS